MNDPKTSPTPTSPTSNVRTPHPAASAKYFLQDEVGAPRAQPSKAIIREDFPTDNQDMAASFLQFCAMCEKQILTPSNSILYCSEACRRKDSCKPLELAVAAMSPPTTPSSSAPSSSRPILPPRIPTGTMSGSTSPVRIPTALDDAKSDLESIRWKPKLHLRAESDASRYLSQFHTSSSAVESDAHDEETPIRTLYSSCSTTSIASMTTPSLSLSHSPTSSSSSLSSSPGYDFNRRPFQSRHTPSYSFSTGTTKGLDLVMPYVATSLPHQTEDHKYEKRSMARMSLQLVKTGCMDWSQWI